jgi:hypothetical protein
LNLEDDANDVSSHNRTTGETHEINTSTIACVSKDSDENDIDTHSSSEPTSTNARSHEPPSDVASQLSELCKQALTVASGTAITALLTSLGGFDGVVGATS